MDFKLFFCLLVIPYSVLAHVSLTFPPARKYNLDYLDSGSPPPCGMPKPKGSIKTSYISGSTINVTWHLGYPHQGSHRIELLAANGTELYMLASELDSDDPTAQRHEVTLPKGFTCKDCIIRLLRQSAELGNPYYWFRSCGDVDIVDKRDYLETCSGRGRPREDGVCGCRGGYWGKRCQYEDECRKDDDCGSHGHCIHLGGTNLPRRQCFCEPGFIGKKCSKANKVGHVPVPSSKTLTDDYLSKNFLSQKIDDRVHLSWRLIEGETLQMEFVMRVNGTSYVALGWRPLEFVGDCTRYPVEETTNSITRVQRQTAKKPVSIDSTSEGNVTQRPRPRPRGPHPMSCADVVIGAARGSLSRILDYWSGDISTPREDSLWDGSDDIEAGAAWESSDGITTLVFRKKVVSEDVTDIYNDWPLDVPSFVIWARGQEHGEYVHRLPAGVDPDQPASVSKFYTKDELKYHGFLGQRGAFSIDFLGDGSREYFLNRPFNKDQ